MPRTKITDVWVRRVTTKKVQEDWWDSQWRHAGSFGLRISKRGTKSWQYIEHVVSYEGDRPSTRRERHALGRYPQVTLDDAVREAERMARSKAHGASTNRDLARTLRERYEREEMSSETIRNRETRLRLYITPRVGDLRVRDTTTPMLQNLVDELESQGKHGLAADVCYTLRAMYKPVLRLGLHDYNPALGLEIAKRDRSSRRGRAAKVDIDVLVRAWSAAEQLYLDALEKSHLFYARQYAALQLQIASLQRTRMIIEIDRNCL